MIVMVPSGLKIDESMNKSQVYSSHAALQAVTKNTEKVKVQTRQGNSSVFQQFPAGCF